MQTSVRTGWKTLEKQGMVMAMGQGYLSAAGALEKVMKKRRFERRGPVGQMMARVCRSRVLLVKQWAKMQLARNIR